MKVIFMGSPKFALTSLQALIDNPNYQITAVFTQGPKKQGRGLSEQKSPVHKLAEEHNLQVYTPSTMKNEEVKNIIHSIEAKAIVVAGYGLILPKEILQAKPFGCLNIHPSLLPRHRGAAPILQSILSGDTETGVSIIQMDEGLDTGDILMQESFEIPQDWDSSELSNKAAQLGANLLIKTLDNLPNIKAKPQASTGITITGKFTKQDGKIDWQESAGQIFNRVRALNPWPGCYFFHGDKKIKLHKASLITTESHNYQAGEVIDDSLQVACKQGIIQLDKLQLEGKKTQPRKEFTNGYPLKQGAILT